jgi:lysozyme family protein
MTAISPRIQQLIDALVPREGGYSNDPDDAGGPTKFGITLATLRDWRKAPVTAADVAGLGLAEATQIYAWRYFLLPHFDQVRDPGLQELLFDFGVNSGTGAAAKALQTVLKREGLYAGDIDGDLGPRTLGALSGVSNLPALFYAVKAERYELLLRDAGARPSDARYAIGWANRLDGFEERF